MGKSVAIHLPDCPRCGNPPGIVISAQQAFCGNPDCDSLCWDMTSTRAEYDATVTTTTWDELEGKDS